MVKRQRRDSTETPANKGENEQQLEARKISAATQYETCSEPLSAFGGVLALIKFLDLIQFEQLFEHCYTKPERETRLGHYPDGGGDSAAAIYRVQPDRAFWLHTV
jgi:hypothetical protein